MIVLYFSSVEKKGKQRVVKINNVYAFILKTWNSIFKVETDIYKLNLAFKKIYYNFKLLHCSLKFVWFEKELLAMLLIFLINLALVMF